MNILLFLYPNDTGTVSYSLLVIFPNRVPMNSADGFTVPSYLYQQMEEFEDMYDDISIGSRYQQLLDNSSDPTCENLYE